jgi:hypothetical protein
LNVVTILGACVGFFLYASLFEYAFHRWILHYPWRWLRHPYRVHVFLHHRVFGQGPAYQTRSQEDRDAILFEWWQAPLLLAVHAPVVWMVERVSGFPVFGGGMLALAGYYALYESLHWCIHTPNGRWIERTRVFRWLDAHHRLHHRLWRVNFNVLVPLGDVLFGTLQPARSRPTPT